MPETSYQRGAFVAYESSAARPPAAQSERRIIPFRFNPENLSWQLQVDQGRSGSGAAGGRRRGAHGAQSADAASGAVKTSFTVKVRFDLNDREEASRGIAPEFGILPEICALEALVHSPPAPGNGQRRARQAVVPRLPRPTVLFVWGRHRVLPVRVTGMTINENLFNRRLNPTRAEIDVQLEVIPEADADNNRLVIDALAFTGRKRVELAQMFLNTTASQTTHVPPTTELFSDTERTTAR